MDYLRPASLDQALAAVAGGARVLAGGTDLYPGAGARLPGPWVDLVTVPGMAGIASGPQGLRIGACTTWSEIAAADLPPAARGLQQAALQVGGRQVQNAGTIAGNLCNASPAADGVAPLLVLDAEVEIASAVGSRRLALHQFILGPRKVALQPGEVVLALHLPQSGLVGRSAFEKLGARAHLVISIVSVAVRLEVSDRRITAAAVAVGSCSPVARRLPDVEAALIGPVDQAARRVDPAAVAAGLAPIDDVRATAAYRQHAAAALVSRAVEGAL
ncbi:xanthine dehydrogenase family protein subunit M [Rhodobacter sp.]